MGLNNSRIRIVNTILGYRKGKDAMSYADNTNFGTEDEYEHLKYLENILSLVYESGVRLKLSKCKCGVRKIENFGHIVDNQQHTSVR